MPPNHFVATIQHEFPSLKIISSEIIEKGSDHSVVVVNDFLVFRFPRTPEYRANFPNEVSLLQALNKVISLPLPCYTYLSKNQGFGGYPLLQGTEFSRAVFEQMPQIQQESMAVQLGNFLSELHAAKTGGVFLKPAATIKDWREEIEPMRDVINARLSSKEKESVSRFIDTFYELDIPTKSSIVHHDLRDDHILVCEDSGRVSGIIDFGDASWGDPAIDFSWFWLLGNDFMTHLLENYAAPADGEFLLRSEYYHYISSLSQIYKGIDRKKERLVKKGINAAKKLTQNGLFTA